MSGLLKGINKMTKTKLNGFYKTKVEAMKYIKKLALAETDLFTTKLAILENYGFGDKFVLGYLETLEEARLK